MYLADIYTVTGSLAGVPGISVPCGKIDAPPDSSSSPSASGVGARFSASLSESNLPAKSVADNKSEGSLLATRHSPLPTSSIKLPVGLQIFGPPFGEARVLQLAHAFEQAGGPEV